ncbi:hypothetical protein ADK34_20760 [Streptomyces viridochromogenes]|uniref:Uncharacterized protein n=2 Tax=Streptomyces TaxID=1883 RepID=A0A0L8KA01_STRVR|nr:hypothetical protein ADK34_20760 [Streptomyces viridochromogenes]
MLYYENEVKKAIDQKQVVYYHVTPEYDGNTVVPFRYRMQAEGWPPLGREEYISMSMWRIRYSL